MFHSDWISGFYFCNFKIKSWIRLFQALKLYTYNNLRLVVATIETFNLNIFCSSRYFYNCNEYPNIITYFYIDNEVHFPSFMREYAQTHIMWPYFLYFHCACRSRISRLLLFRSSNKCCNQSVDFMYHLRINNAFSTSLENKNITGATLIPLCLPSRCSFTLTPPQTHAVASPSTKLCDALILHKWACKA